MDIKPQLEYSNKVIMAPMVKVGCLPMRLLAIKYGADIVYTEEIIDWKLLNTKRRINDVLGTVDFVDQDNGTIVFRTCSLETDKLVIQIGTSDENRALQVAKMIENDVSGIDINMGCPKEFSVKGGMGVALLSKPEKAKTILKTLVDNVSIPITCKIRIFKNLDDTINLVKELASTGIKAIGCHGRTKNERPRHPVNINAIQKVAEAINIPVLANGGSKDIHKYKDILKFKQLCKTSSVMIGRAAQWNVSIFRKDGLLPLDDVIDAYLRLAIEYDNSPSNTKYCVQNMLRELQETPRGKKFLECQTLEQICDIWNLSKYCRTKQLEYQTNGLKGRRAVIPNDFNEPDMKKRKINDDITQHNISFIRVNYTKDTELPKSRLHLYAIRNSIRLPTYETEQNNKLFRTIITFHNKKYLSTFWEKNKKNSEQCAALVCLLGIGQETEETLIENGSILKKINNDIKQNN